jgi:hypothetical protein
VTLTVWRRQPFSQGNTEAGEHGDGAHGTAGFPEDDSVFR